VRPFSKTIFLYQDDAADRLINFRINEHAFMIDYGLKRADYIAAFFKSINRATVEARAKQQGKIKGNGLSVCPSKSPGIPNDLPRLKRVSSVRKCSAFTPPGPHRTSRIAKERCVHSGSA
jgi:hypothetical protein